METWGPYRTQFKNLWPGQLNWPHFPVANIQDYDLSQLYHNAFAKGWATWSLILVYSKAIASSYGISVCIRKGSLSLSKNIFKLA